MQFETTHWSLVLAARGESSEARAALATLCERYWYPLYAYVRRRGHDAEDAQDLTQGFLTSLLARRDFETLGQEHGRFRAFLLASLQHFLANDRARHRARKRGGGSAPPLPLDADEAERRYRIEPATAETPETIFDRRWALTVIERAFQDLRAQARASGREAEFAALKDSLLGQAPADGYAAVAAALGSTEGAVKVAAHRLRRRFGDALRRQIAETVLEPRDVDEEIRYLIRVVAR